MAISDIVLLGDPRLRERSAAVTDFDSQSTQTIKAALEHTLLDLQRRHLRGGGLAAPQLGYLSQIIFLNARGRSLFLFNPTITEKSSELFDVWDFCFSAEAAFIAKIKRHKKITVEFTDERGRQRTEQYEDYWSELVQHEIDHLHGRLFIDLIEEPNSITMMKEWNRQHPPDPRAFTED